LQPLRADARRNRERILAAARELFADEGPAARMDAVAARAGLAVGTLYRHFPTKEALLEAVVQDRARAAEARARAALERVGDGADPAAEVDDLMRWYASVLLEDRAWKAAAAAAGLLPDPYPYSQGSARAALDAAGELLAAAQRAGAVRPDLTAGDLALLLGGLPGGEVPPDTRARYLDVVLSGLRPR